jgi:hypothetical protein
LVILLTGELGNNLAKISHGINIQQMALEQEQINFTLRFVSQGYDKSELTRHELQQCFSKHFSENQLNLAEWSALSSQWESIVQSQARIIDRLYANDTLDQSHYTNTKDSVSKSQRIMLNRPSLQAIRSSLIQVLDVTHRLSNQSLSYTHHDEYILLKTHNLSVPFVIANSMSFLTQEWTHEFFTYDFHKPECCHGSPYADETVLHIRGFEIELKGYYYEELFRELDPTRTAQELLGHLKPGHKVAIVSRSSEQEIRSYIEAIQKRGLVVRYVSDMNGIQTFCFLLTASKEIVGTVQSTFFRWAAILNRQVQSVVMYCLNYTQHKCPPWKKPTNHWKTPMYQLLEAKDR